MLFPSSSVMQVLIFFLMLVVDLLHEFELGVCKAVFIHLLRMLDSLKVVALSELDQW